MLVVSTMSLSSAARGQEADSSGSLTVVSRPSGAACRVRGDRIVVGTTPLTLSTIPGRYEVRSVDPAFERWERTIRHDGARDDTVWMSLHPKTRSRAVLRSIGIPGWGQFYSRRPSAGWAYLTGATVAFGASIAWQVAYVERQEDVEQAETLPEWEQAVRRLDEARDARNLLQGAAGALWILSVIDAGLFFPRFKQEGLSAGIEIRPDPAAKGVRLAATLDF